MRKFALTLAIHEPNEIGLSIVNREAKRLGETEYPQSTWEWIIRDEVPRISAYGDQFFTQHTDKPMSAAEMRKQFPL